MIRSFTSLCKLILLNLTDESIFSYVTHNYSYHKQECPKCNAVGKLASYGDYARNLVSCINMETNSGIIRPFRFKCGSCRKTHALLPGILIPYSPYSLRFILTVLIAYYERSITVIKLCERFNIAVSTLYEWKKRMLSHKDLMLGMLKSLKETALGFLKGILRSPVLSELLCDFYQRHEFSFMQTKSVPATQSHPP